VSHRGSTYGLVAPLFEMAKVCANHLAQMGIGRYVGSQASTKLKVTGIDLFSAGNYQGGAGAEEILYQDPGAGIYKKLVIRDNRLDGALLYGDTVEGPGSSSSCARVPTSPTCARICCSARRISAMPATAVRPRRP
jgi:nitrite reductase (NADH) large subunit